MNADVNVYHQIFSRNKLRTYWNLSLEQVSKWFDIFTGSLGVNNVFQNSSALINYFNAVQSLTQNGIQEIQKMNFTKVIFLLSVL